MVGTHDNHTQEAAYGRLNTRQLNKISQEHLFDDASRSAFKTRALQGADRGTKPESVIMNRQEAAEKNGLKAPLELGRLVATRAAHALIVENGLNPSYWINRHSVGDWGNVCPADKARNTTAANGDERVLSAYPIDPSQPCEGFGDNCMWIITEYDRSVTTILLPSDY